jgi:ATP-dependent helicase/nuclease subunit B
MLQAVVSTSARERLEAAHRYLDRFGPAAEIVVMAATREAADDFCRAAAAGRGATFGLHRFTLGQFAARTAGAALAARGLSPSTPLGAEALAARAAFEVRRRAPLAYLEPVAACPGFPRALSATLQELREAGIGRDAVAALSAPGPDLARLLEEHERQLAEGGVGDRATLLAETARLLRAGAAGPLTGLPVLLLDVRIASQAERAVLAALADTATDVLITVPAGDERTLTHLGSVAQGRGGAGAQDDGEAHEDTRTGESKSGRTGERESGRTEARESGRADVGQLARLRANLFSAGPRQEAPKGAQDDEVVFFSAPGEGRECVEVTRRILAEAARGVAFDEMAVVVRTPDTYWAPLEQALTRAQVPAWYSRGTRRPDPTGRAFLALLACAGEGLSARRFAEYLSLGQAPRRDERGAPAPEPPPAVVSREDVVNAGQLSLFALLDAPTGHDAARGPGDGGGEEHVDPTVRDVRTPWKWEALIVESSVVHGGAARWRRRFDGLSAELTLKLGEAESEEPDSAQAAALRRDRDALDDLARFALPLIEDLEALPAAATWGMWLDRFTALAPRALRHPARVLELLADLRPMASVGPLTLAEVRQVLVPRLSTLEREPPRLRYGRVFIATPDQLRGRSFRTVFATGLAERIFPQRARQDPLLLDTLRQQLGPALVVEDDRVVAERLLLRIVAGAATERLFLSYPRLDVAQARPRVPSFYALDVMRALTGAVPDHETFERDTALATGAWLAWPAPEKPETAIDTWEHDLAILGPLLEPGGAQAAAKGRAHYLLALNAHLARSLRARWARWKKRWSAYDGLVESSESVRTLLAPQRLTARAYSASSLQRFSTCPYQFLLGAIYRLEPLERPAPLVQLDPLTRGALFHEVQRDLLRALAAASLLPLSPATRLRGMALLDEAFDAVIARAHERLVPAIERVWQDETEAMRADLRLWIGRMADSSDGWVPRHFELSFGLPLDADHDAASVRAPVVIDGRFPLRGAIDLIEVHSEIGWLRITDHKTGRNRTTPYLVVGGGATLQPVLYGLAAEQVLGRSVTAGRLAFVTTVGGFTEHVVSLRDEARRAGIEVLEIIDRAVEMGSLPPAPREGACGFCDFKAICGPLEERRFKHKPRDAPGIADLLEMRRLR